MNLLSSINLLLAHGYSGMSWLNHGLIRFKKFARKVLKNCTISHFSFTFNASYMCQTSDVRKNWDVKSAYRYTGIDYIISKSPHILGHRFVNWCSGASLSGEAVQFSIKKSRPDGNLQWWLLRPCCLGADVLSIWMWLPLCLVINVTWEIKIQLALYRQMTVCIIGRPFEMGGPSKWAARRFRGVCAARSTALGCRFHHRRHGRCRYGRSRRRWQGSIQGMSK
jgi:hypothetical protein